MSQPTVAHWISVDEQLPEERLGVLVYIVSPMGGMSGIWPARLIGGYFWDIAHNPYDSDKITHWAPLPEGPK